MRVMAENAFFGLFSDLSIRERTVFMQIMHRNPLIYAFFA